jgi:poly(A) polymerase
MKPNSAFEIVSRLRQKGHEAYLVGGCVRDMVMQLEPADYDIATSALPDEIMKIFPHTQPVGVRFGVVLVIYRGHPFEVATFRSDDSYADGRRPTSVTFTDVRTDVLRRDFTINGLLYDPDEKRVIDYVEGQRDIENRIVRAIGDPVRRFEEDKLRLLRAIRFGARLGYSIEPATWSAVCQMASAIRQVSAERIREEVFRILVEGRPALGLRLMEESGLLKAVLPEIKWTDHTNKVLELVPKGVAADFAFAVLLHDVTPEHVEAVVERFRLSTAESRHVLSLVQGFPRLQSLSLAPVHEAKRFMRTARFEDHLELARICATAAGTSLEPYKFATNLARQWSEMEINPDPLVSGNDLIQMGFVPGPAFRTILTRVEDEQLDGRLIGRQQALDFVRETFGP